MLLFLKTDNTKRAVKPWLRFVSPPISLKTAYHFHKSPSTRTSFETWTLLNRPSAFR